MWSTLFWVCVGILIGWNLPQPAWAKSLQDKVVAAIKGLENNGGNEILGMEDDLPLWSENALNHSKSDGLLYSFLWELPG